MRFAHALPALLLLAAAGCNGRTVVLRDLADREAVRAKTMLRDAGIDARRVAGTANAALSSIDVPATQTDDADTLIDWANLAPKSANAADKGESPGLFSPTDDAGSRGRELRRQLEAALLAHGGVLAASVVVSLPVKSPLTLDAGGKVGVSAWIKVDADRFLAGASLAERRTEIQASLAHAVAGELPGAAGDESGIDVQIEVSPCPLRRAAHDSDSVHGAGTAASRMPTLLLALSMLVNVGLGVVVARPGLLRRGAR